jgi:hypothetical protein
MLNRIAATQNYTTKEGFSMRRVTFKALAVWVGLAVLMIAAPWFSETVWAGPFPENVEQPVPVPPAVGSIINRSDQQLSPLVGGGGGLLFVFDICRSRQGEWTGTSGAISIPPGLMFVYLGFRVCSNFYWGEGTHILLQFGANPFVRNRSSWIIATGLTPSSQGYIYATLFSTGRQPVGYAFNVILVGYGGRVIDVLDPLLIIGDWEPRGQGQQDEVRFRGQLRFVGPGIPPQYYSVMVEEVLSGRLAVGQLVNVSALGLNCQGFVDPSLSPLSLGARVEVYGRLNRMMEVDICPNQNYYIRAIGNRGDPISVQARVTINGSCNQDIAIGTPTNITVEILSITPPGATASFQLRLLGPQAPPGGSVFGRERLANLSQGAVVNFPGQASAPAGPRTIILERLLPNGQVVEVTRCNYRVVDGQPPPPPGGQLITLYINAWRLPDSPPNPDLVPLRIVIRRPGAACPQPMGQCPSDEVIPFYLLRLDGAMPFTRQLPANTAIQIEALRVVGRAFVRFDRKDEQGRVVSSDSVNPVMYSVLPCWGAQPCNAPNGPLTVTAVYR